MAEWVEMMYWDCPSCGTTQIDGVIDNCPSCGAAHDLSEAPWYALDGPSYANRIQDEKILKVANAGPNWKCAHCGGTQRRNDGSCQNCGASQETGSNESSPDNQKRSYWEDELFEDVLNDWKLKKKSKRKKLLMVLLPVFTVLLSITGWYLLHEKALTLTVDNIYWTHQVPVERKMVMTEQGFDESIPPRQSNAEELGIVGKAFNVVLIDPHHYHHTDKVPDGFRTEHYTERRACGRVRTGTSAPSCTTSSNGTRRCRSGSPTYSTKYCTDHKTRQVQKYREVPRYEAYYQWNVWRWRVQRTLQKDGHSLKTTWPSEEEICLNCKVQGLEQERLGERKASYSVRFIDKRRKVYDMPVESLEKFQHFPIGSTHHCMYKRLFGVNCDAEFESTSTP